MTAAIIAGCSLGSFIISYLGLDSGLHGVVVGGGSLALLLRANSTNGGLPMQPGQVNRPNIAFGKAIGPITLLFAFGVVAAVCGVVAAQAF